MPTPHSRLVFPSLTSDVPPSPSQDWAEPSPSPRAARYKADTARLRASALEAAAEHAALVAEQTAATAARLAATTQQPAPKAPLPHSREAHAPPLRCVGGDSSNARPTRLKKATFRKLQEEDKPHAPPLLQPVLTPPAPKVAPPPAHSAHKAERPAELAAPHGLYDDPSQPQPPKRRRVALPASREEATAAVAAFGKRHYGAGCAACGAKSAPMWRNGPLGRKTLCNACGVKYKTALQAAELLDEAERGEATA